MFKSLLPGHQLARPRTLLLGLGLVAVPILFLFSASDRADAGVEKAAASTKETSDGPAGSRYKLVQRSYSPGLKAIVGITGRKSDKPLSVQVLKDGKPAAGEIVEFRLLSRPSKAKGAILAKKQVITDAKGLARVKFTPGDKEGDYLVAAYLHGTIRDQPPVVTRIKAMTSAWIMFLVFGLLGGLGLFLYGMNLAGEHLQKAAGEQMRTWIGSLARNRFSGVLLGTAASGVLQSSSAATVMLVGFVTATMITLTQAISVMIGAKIGVTITVQLIAFNISKYALAIVGAGGLLIMAAGRREKLIHAGAILLGFGLIFFGLSVMSGSMKPLRGMPEFTGLLLQVSSSAALAMILGMAFTAIIQSSAATVAICMALAAQGLLPLAAAIPLSIGASIGTCATALLASLGASKDGKRVAVVHLIFSVAAASLFLPLMGPFVSLTRTVTSWMGSDSVIREIANGFMLFSIFSAIIFLPFVKQLEWLVVKLIPKEEKPPPFGPKYLNDAALTVPVMALEQAQREVERMAQIFSDNVRAAGKAFESGDVSEMQRIMEEDEKLDILETAIRPFLAKIAQSGLSSEAAARERGLIYITEHLEGAGDLLAKQVLAPAEKLLSSGQKFSDEGASELLQYHEKIAAKAERVAEAVQKGDRVIAEQVQQITFKELQLERKLRGSHLERLHAGGDETVASSRVHLAVLAGLNGVGGKLSDVAEEILREM